MHSGEIMFAEITLNNKSYYKQYHSTLEIINCECPAPRRARTIVDFESWSVILKINLRKSSTIFHVTWVTSMGYIPILWGIEDGQGFYFTSSGNKSVCESEKDFISATVYTVRNSFREFQKPVFIDLLSNSILLTESFTTSKFCKLSDYVHL